MKIQNNKSSFDMDEFRLRMLKYTTKTFQRIPVIENPTILDVGCGSGIPTIELARLSKGSIKAIDINSEEIKKLKNRMREEHFADQIEPFECSLFETPFQSESFDIIWAEGVFHIIGFEKAFKESNRLLKKGGFLVLNEVIKGIEPTLERLSHVGFKLYDRMKLPEGAWWVDFYKPMEKKINDLRKRNPRSLDNEKIRECEKEIKILKKNPNVFDCAFYILQKVENIGR